MEPSEISKLFPLMDDERLAELAADIKRKGLLEPVVTYQGQILDGRNRDAACRLAGVEPHYVEFDGPDPVSYVISKNFKRRDLNPIVRLQIALQARPLLEAEELRLLAEADRKNEDPRKVPTAMEQVAKLAQVSGATIERYNAVQEKAAPELKAAVADGTVGLIAAAAALNEPPERQAELVQKVRSGEARGLESAMGATARNRAARFKSIEKFMGQLMAAINRGGELGDVDAEYAVKAVETVKATRYAIIAWKNATKGLA